MSDLGERNDPADRDGSGTGGAGDGGSGDGDGGGGGGGGCDYNSQSFDQVAADSSDDRVEVDC